MKSLYLLVGLISSLSLAAATCECPLVKCGGTAAAVSSISPCSLSPPIFPNMLPLLSTKLPMLTPNSSIQICQCQNNAAISCYEKCGGPRPTLKVSQHLSSHIQPPPVSSPKITTSSLPQPCPTPAPTTTSEPPKPTRQACGRRGLPPCRRSQTCINDPSKPNCDIAFDCPGICVRLDGPKCGGIVGLKCPKGKVCVDDPRE